MINLTTTQFETKWTLEFIEINPHSINHLLQTVHVTNRL